MASTSKPSSALVVSVGMPLSLDRCSGRKVTSLCEAGSVLNPSYEVGNLKKKNNFSVCQ